MTNNHWTLIGATYAIFAIATASLATSQTSPARLADQPKVVAQADQGPLVCRERLVEFNPRKYLFLTIWSTRNCSACDRQEAEIPALEKAGYNVILRKAPAPRWVRSFPTTIVTKGSPTGNRVADWTGFKTLAEIDARLKIREVEEEEEEEEVEDIDYDIFWVQVKALNLVVWLNDTKECDRQYEEISKLRKIGFSANVYMVSGPKTPPSYVINFPTVILINNRKGGVVCIWTRFVTAHTIRMTAQDRV